ncbi:MAG: hypothetical protein L3K26_18060, partial [Candidatus Hydrogenedentes bacterium]|nr:hypothetical protein [Candidatus Hydrogenedentota bacterium]
YGGVSIAPRLLSPDELNPERGKWDADNYWGVQAVRPTVTGFRSFLKDLRWHWNRCRIKNVSSVHLPALMLLRVVDRPCYLRGWKAGVRQAKAEYSPCRD